MRKIRELNTDIYVLEQDNSSISLLQSPSRIPLSKLKSNSGPIRGIINCSYFTTTYVLGRNQGDLFNDAPDQDFWSVVIRKDGSYGCEKYTSADERYDIVAGFSPAVVLIKNGQEVELISNAISGAKARLTSVNPNTAFGIKKDGKAILIVNEGRSKNDAGLTGRQLRMIIKKYYDLDLLVLLDGGGSTEMIYNGKIVNTLTDGHERTMFNGIAFIDGEEKPMIIEPVKRDESVNQLKVLVDNLRVRSNHSTAGDVIGYVQKDGIYNNLDTRYMDNVYEWYKIGENQWIANDSREQWIERLDKKESEEVKQLKEENIRLNKEIEKLNEKIKNAISYLE